MAMKEGLDYFYGHQAYQFARYWIPKMLFTDPDYKGLSAEAKLLYGILLDRAELSLKNGWLDDLGRVYIIYTIEEMMEALGCANQKIAKLLDELERKAGLIERKRQGLNKPNLIYVKNFFPSHFLPCENHTSGNVKTTSLEVPKSHGINPDNINTNNSNNQSFYPDRCDGMVLTEQYRDYFWDSLDMEALLIDKAENKDSYLEVFQLLVDCVSTTKQTIRVCGEDRPVDLVRGRLMKLNRNHLEYVVDSVSANTTNIRDMKQYLLTSLYNATMTLNSHYASMVSRDLADEGFSVPRRRKTVRYGDRRDYDYEPGESL